MEVLDFGGGAGHHQAVAKIVFPEIHFNWTVVETDELVQRAQGEIKDLGLDFISSLEKVKRVKFDLVFSNSAIQYLPNPLLELKKLVNLDFEYLFLTRIPLRRSGKSLRYIQSSKLSQNGPGPAPLNFKDAIIEYHASIVEKYLVEEILDTSLQSRVLIDEGDWDASRFGKTVGVFSYLGKSKQVKL